MRPSIVQRLSSLAFDPVVRKAPPLVGDLQECRSFNLVISRVGQVNTELGVLPAFFRIGHERSSSTVHESPPTFSPVVPSKYTESLLSACVKSEPILAMRQCKSR